MLYFHGREFLTLVSAQQAQGIGSCEDVKLLVAVPRVLSQGGGGLFDGDTQFDQVPQRLGTLSPSYSVSHLLNLSLTCATDPSGSTVVFV